MLPNDRDKGNHKARCAVHDEEVRLSGGQHRLFTWRPFSRALAPLQPGAGNGVVGNSPAEVIESLPMAVDCGSSGPRQRDSRSGCLADECLVDPDEPGVLELGEVAGKVSLAQSGEPLGVEQTPALKDPR